MAYHTKINQVSSIRRAYTIQNIMPAGMGTIYAWDWAYVLSGNNQKNSVSLDNNSVRFSYIGLANQLTTSKRISQHISDSQKAIKEDRGLYVALGNALDPENSNSVIKNMKNLLTKSNNGVVEIIHIASLFDLGPLETYLIEKEKTSFNYNSTNFSDLISDVSKTERGRKVGLNTAEGGQGQPTSGGTTTSFREWILAAYLYFIEKDPEVIAARRDTDDSNKILAENNNDYGKAITQLIKERIDGVDTSSKQYTTSLQQVVAEVSGKGYSLEEGTGKEIDFKEKFKESAKLQAAFIFQIDDKQIKITRQVDKKIALANILSDEWSLSAPDSVIKILDKINKDMKRLESNSVIKEGLERGIAVKKEAIRQRGAKKITSAYSVELTELIIKEAIKNSKNKKTEELYTGMIYGKIEELLKTKYPKVFSKNTEIFSNRYYLYEKAITNKLGFFLTEDSLAKLVSVLENYVEVFYSLTGEAPTPKEIGGILGEASKDAFSDRILQQLTRK